MIQVRQGPGGGGQGGQQGGQSNPNQATSSVVQVNPTLTVVSTSTASPTSTGSPTSTAKSTSTAAASSSSGSQKGAIIGGVLGGIGGLLIIALIAICLLQRRKKKSLKEKHGSAQPVTYTGLNAAFAGVPFRQQPNTPHADDRLLATGTMYPSAEPSPTGLGIRGGGDTSPYSTPGMEADPFLPSYAQSQSGMSSGGRNSFGRLNSVNTSISSPSTADVSPMSAHPSPSPMSAHAHPSGRSVLPPPIPQFANAMAVSSIPEVDSPRFQLEHRDTMGFPVDSDSPEIPSTPYQEIPLAAPAPRHPLIHQDSLERVVRQGMSTPEPGTLAPTNPLLQQPRHSGPVSRLLSGQYPATESPVLGMQNPVTIHAPQPAALQPSGLGRNVSQRTVSSVSSMGPSVISDTELERLGVGPGGRF